MKKTIIFLAFGLNTLLSFAQRINENEVPGVVKKHFKKEFSQTQTVKWEKEKANYEASFINNKTNCSVLMDAQGNIIEKENEIKLSELPIGVVEYVKTHYTGKEIKEAAKITNAKGVITYEAEIKGLDLLFDSFGDFLKEVKD